MNADLKHKESLIKIGVHLRLSAANKYFSASSLRMAVR
jgi:hypothetical protein